MQVASVEQTMYCMYRSIGASQSIKLTLTTPTVVSGRWGRGDDQVLVLVTDVLQNIHSSLNYRLVALRRTFKFSIQCDELLVS